MNPTRAAEISRRSFLDQSSRLALLAAVLPGSLAAAPGGKWPVSCRDMYLKLGGGPDCWSSLKALGAEGAEVSVSLDLNCPSLFHPEHKYTLATPEGIGLLKQDLAASGCRITAFMMANRFEDRFEQELDCARSLVRAAQTLGVDAIRIDMVPSKLSAEAFLPVAIKAGKGLCAIAAGTPVRFGIENHGRVTNDPEFLEKLFAAVGSPQLGLTLDCANFYWWGHPLNNLYAIYERFASRVVHTHCKSIRYPEDKKNIRREMGWEYGKYNCPIYEGDIDFNRLAGILRRANYRGDLCVEDESLEKFPAAERAAVIKREIAMLKSLA